MKKDLFSILYDHVYKKSTLEAIMIDLEVLSEKLKGSRKQTKEKALDLIKTTVLNDFLKTTLEQRVNDGDLNSFSEKSLQTLLLKMQDITNNTQLIMTTVAIPLTEPDMQEIAKLLEQKVSKKVILDLKVDPNIIGGIIVKEDKYIVDASLRNHLKNYENEWIKSLKKNRKALENA